MRRRSSIADRSTPFWIREFGGRQTFLIFRPTALRNRLTARQNGSSGAADAEHKVVLSVTAVYLKA
jgi:hypothetical protein